MGKIQVLDTVTIDKIAAGEVIERPASVVKELVENAIDAGSTAVVVEIKEGGISYMRIADNGSGIRKDDVRNAFLRHSTSKIRKVEDLTHIHSLGFRGEALSSIAAVSQVELITKTKDDVYGTRYCISGGKEESLEETGAKDGTTFIIRQLFYNTPARRKFLKTPMTEASHIGDLMTRLALSHPEVSFQFINNGQSKVHTSGNGNLKDVIYHVYGREIAANLLKAEQKNDWFSIRGYLGKPIISRGNRNFENYFINGRYIKNNIIAKAIEDAYKDFSMQHKYPFVVLQMDIDGECVDVNVHPAKMELRFNNQQEVYNAVYDVVSQGLHEKELIPHVEIDVPKMSKPPEERMSVRPAQRVSASAPTASKTGNAPLAQNVSPPGNAPLAQNVSPFGNASLAQNVSPAGNTPTVATAPQAGAGTTPAGERNLDYFMQKMRERVTAYYEQEKADTNVVENTAEDLPEDVSEKNPQIKEEIKQLDLFEERLLSKEACKEHKIIGQVFDTYWLVEFKDSLYIIDQHAAHERVLYERTLKEMKTREFTSQMISPPIILNLSMQEAELLRKYMDQFVRIGFEFEEFGEESYAVRAVPGNLFSIAKKDLLLQMLDGLSDEISRNASPDLIDEKVASMSCKAAVKGHMKLSVSEVDTLIGELLTLENPYHCPHGRPTIIAMSKRELEKKFKRIV